MYIHKNARSRGLASAVAEIPRKSKSAIAHFIFMRCLRLVLNSRGETPENYYLKDKSFGIG